MFIMIIHLTLSGAVRSPFTTTPSKTCAPRHPAGSVPLYPLYLCASAHFPTRWTGSIPKEGPYCCRTRDLDLRYLSFDWFVAHWEPSIKWGPTTGCWILWTAPVGNYLSLIFTMSVLCRCRVQQVSNLCWARPSKDFFPDYFVGYLPLVWGASVNFSPTLTSLCC